MKIDLHFTATSVEELKKQLKQAYEELAGPVVETPKKESTLKTGYLLHSREIATKTKAAMAEKKKNLKKYTGALFGWDVDKDDNLHPNWEEQDKITLMREWYKELGSYPAVAKRAQEAGWKGKKGGKWTTYLVRSTLSNDLHERVVEFTRPMECKACNGAHRAHTCEKAKAKTEAKAEAKAKPKPKLAKKANANLVCKDCGTTKTPQWRDKTRAHGPICNACAMTRKREARKLTEPASKESRRKSRNDDISAGLKSLRGRKTKKTKKKTTPKPVPKAKIEVTEDAFLRWSEGNISSMILRKKTFLVGSGIIETWFTTINPNENFGSWCNNNLPTYMTHVKEIFNEFQAAYPTIFMVQDAGDNCVLMVNQPKALTAKMLDKVRWV